MLTTFLLQVSSFQNRIVNWTSFAQKPPFHLIVIAISFFFLIQEFSMYKKTKKIFHRMYYIGFLCMMIFSLLFFILPKEENRHLGSPHGLFTGSIMALFGILSICFLIYAIKLHNRK